MPLHALALQVVLGIAGGCFLVRMSWLAFLEARKRPAIALENIRETKKNGDFSTGVLFGLANPVGLAFWSGVGSGVATTNVTGLTFIVFFCGFFIGASCWSLFVGLAVRSGRKWISPKAFRWVNLLSGLLIGYFGLRILWNTVQALAEHYSMNIWRSGGKFLLASD
jgi:chemosensory pili system protein ChpE